MRNAFLITLICLLLAAEVTGALDAIVSNTRGPATLLSREYAPVTAMNIIARTLYQGNKSARGELAYNTSSRFGQVIAPCRPFDPLAPHRFLVEHEVWREPTFWGDHRTVHYYYVHDNGSRWAGWGPT